MVTNNANSDISMSINLDIKNHMKQLNDLSRRTSVELAKLSKQSAFISAGKMDPIGNMSDSKSIKMLSAIKADIKESYAQASKAVKDYVDIQKDRLAKVAAANKKVTKSVKDLRRETRAEFGKNFADSVQKQYNTLNKSIPKMDRYRMAIRMTRKQITAATKQGQTQFAGWALSLMFFGQSLKRVFNSIWSASTKVFNEVAHSTEGTVTGFDILSGSMTYLKFVAGQALEPITRLLVPIIDYISQWVSENETLFMVLVAGAGALGTALATFGAGKLALDGITSALALAGVEASALVGILTSPVTLGIAAGLAAFLLAYENDFLGFKDFIDTTLESIKPLFKKLWEDIKIYFNGFTTFLSGIFTGDFKKAFNGLSDMAESFNNAMRTIFVILGAALINAFVWTWNAILSFMGNAVKSTIELIMDAWNAMLKLMNKKPVDYKGITTGLDEAIQKTKASFGLNYLDPTDVNKLLELMRTEREAAQVVSSMPMSTAPGAFTTGNLGTGLSRVSEEQAQASLATERIVINIDMKDSLIAYTPEQLEQLFTPTLTRVLAEYEASR